MEFELTVSPGMRDEINIILLTVLQEIRILTIGKMPRIKYHFFYCSQIVIKIAAIGKKLEIY